MLADDTVRICDKCVDKVKQRQEAERQKSKQKRKQVEDAKERREKGTDDAPVFIFLLSIFCDALCVVCCVCICCVCVCLGLCVYLVGFSSVEQLNPLGAGVYFESNFSR